MTAQPLPPRTGSPPGPVTLRPSPGVAGRWAVAALLLVAAGLYLVLDTGGDPLTFPVLVAFAAVAGYFLVQALAPGLVEVRLEPNALRASTFGRRTEVAWEEVHLARVTRLAGEPVLHLRLRPGTTAGGTRRSALTVLLPLGCDEAALHRFLAARLGRGPAPGGG